MPRKSIVNPRLGNDQVLPSEVSRGQVLRRKESQMAPVATRADFADQKKVDKLYRWR